jgi:hypothetical protein
MHSTGFCDAHNEPHHVLLLPTTTDHLRHTDAIDYAGIITKGLLEVGWRELSPLSHLKDDVSPLRLFVPIGWHPVLFRI